MRICSFLPSATEILYSLGLGESVVGVTHECDFPPEIMIKSQVVKSSFDLRSLSSSEIDTLVSESSKAGKSTYIVELDALREARPDLIVTQDLCEVCAVSGDETIDAIKALDHTPEVVSLYPKSLEGILDTIIVLGEATGTQRRAREVTEALRGRIEAVRSALAGERDRPRVFPMEWLEPPYVGGHWVPEMIEIAGGDCGLGEAGEPSRRVSWEEIEGFAPQMIIVMACGFDVERTIDEIDAVTSNPSWRSTPASRKGHVYITDANSYFSRPGPRIVEALEILARILHPEVCDYPIPVNSVINLRNYLYFQNSLG